jgi:protein tyrosine/serine phosphatase
MHNSSRPIPESYWVVPNHFLAGEYPGLRDYEPTRQRLEAFLEAGFDTFIDLTSPGECEPYQSFLSEEAASYEKEIRYQRFPIGDFGLPTRENMRAILNCLDTSLAEGRRLYLHCQAGIGRTGTTVGCYLVRHGLTGSEALRQLAQWWQAVPKSSYYAHSPETDEQVKFILKWAG